VKLVRLSGDSAEHQLRTGRVVAVVTVPPGFIASLKGMVKSPRLELQLARGTISSRVEQQVQALVYSLNRQLQRAYIEHNLRYVSLILKGGDSSFLGQPIEVLGIEKAEKLLDGMSDTPRNRQLRGFLHDARLALANTGDALRSTAHPIELVRAPVRGRTWVLSAEVQAYALGLTITFLALMLAAGSLAAERDENVIGRLARGLVGLGLLIWAKIALAAGVALVLGLAISIAFGAVIEVGLLLAGACLGALGALLGALAREARSASLVAVLVVMPIVFLGLIPREVVPPAAWASDVLPFAHSVRFFSAALYDLDPWTDVLREGLWLVVLGAVFGGLARIEARRLLA
jgi:ABC-2 family transporter protein